MNRSKRDRPERNRRTTGIRPDEAGKPLEEWLARRYTYRSLDEWRGEVEAGRILVDGEGADPRAQLVAGQSVSYDPPLVPEPPVNREYRVVYEDSELLVIDKPADIPSHPGGIYLHNSLVSLLKERYGEVYLANRLDRETSGLMLVARTKMTATFLFRELKERRVVKEYLALVDGEFPARLDARGWLEQDVESVVRKKRSFLLDPAAVDPGDAGSPGRQYAQTGFELVETGNGVSLVRCRLYTGKTHQIRATLCSLGYPIVGDKIYGRDETIFLRFAAGRLGEDDRQRLELPNQALQSSRVRFRPRAEAKELEFSAPRPEWACRISLP